MVVALLRIVGMLMDKEDPYQVKLATSA